jgi:geranylgeranyl pyrophosphate synthase
MSADAVDASVVACADPRLAEAVQYVLANPGKQLRSRLTLESCELIAGKVIPAARTIATAIEWLHAYSLVHDDLPAMDNDEMRRGKPTVHVVYDEATAILVGDGLQAAAFRLIANEVRLSAEARIDIVALISAGVGFGGMVGGQALDMAAEHATLSVASLQQIHAQKTGALIKAAILAGARCAEATEEANQTLAKFADLIGLGFQVADDVLDVTQTTAALGKTAGKDQVAEKSTYVSCLGLEGATQEAERLLQEALTCLDYFGEAAAALRSTANTMVKRQY